MLLGQTATSMHGSKEGHTGYVYRRNGSKTTTRMSTASEAASDPLFVHGIELLRAGLDRLKAWVDCTLEKKMYPRATTRAQRKALDNPDNVKNIDSK